MRVSTCSQDIHNLLKEKVRQKVTLQCSRFCSRSITGGPISNNNQSYHLVGGGRNAVRSPFIFWDFFLMTARSCGKAMKALVRERFKHYLGWTRVPIVLPLLSRFRSPLSQRADHGALLAGSRFLLPLPAVWPWAITSLRFSFVKSRRNSTWLSGLSWWLSELIHGKHF